MFPRILAHLTEWVKAHRLFGYESEERRSHTWVFLRTWRKGVFYRVAVGVIDQSYGDSGRKPVIHGQVIRAIDSGACLV